MITAHLNIDVSNPIRIIEAISPDMENTQRFEVELIPGAGKLDLKIKANDLAAMKAAINSYLRLISVAEQSEE